MIFLRQTLSLNKRTALTVLEIKALSSGMADKLVVNLGERSYPIHFASSVIDVVRTSVTGYRAAGRPLVVLTDRNLESHQAGAIEAMFTGVPQITVEPGESAKTLKVLGEVLDFLALKRIDRRGVLFAVGGGVIGDLGGYAAAAWLRGIEFIQVPTTLLAMVDSSVGGKTGINLAAGKNLVGAFHQPRAVFIGTDVLNTLPPREFAAGMAEVIKYGLLGDGALFTQLERSPLTLQSASLAGVIRRCCELKAQVVEADEFERAKEGGRALLNLGHTFGHAIEQAAGYGTYLHGEAVAIGLCAAARLSEKLALISSSEVARVERVVAAHQLPTRLSQPLRMAELVAAMARDKKVRDGALRFVVLKKVGEAVTKDDVPAELAQVSFREVGAK